MLLELLMTSCLPPVLDMVLEQIKNYLSIPLALSGSFASIIACRVLSPVWFKVYDNHSFFIQTISIAPLHVYYNLEALPTQHEYCVGVSSRSTTGNCEQMTCPRSLRGGYRAGVEPTTFRTIGVDSTNEPLRPIYTHSLQLHR